MNRDEKRKQYKDYINGVIDLDEKYGALDRMMTFNEFEDFCELPEDTLENIINVCAGIFQENGGDFTELWNDVLNQVESNVQSD